MALNKGYGGMYVVDLGGVLRPGLEEVLTFWGGRVWHVGELVRRGVRYVIVGFCYIEKEGDDEDGMKRRKMEGVC